MSDWLDEIAAVNADTRIAVRELIDQGLSGDDIVASLDPIFDESRVDFGPAETVDPMIEFAKAMLALAGREQVVNVTIPKPEPQPAPLVTVNVPKAEPVVNVKASMPSEMKITSMPTRVTQRRVKRDKSGLITETGEVESDA